MFSQNVNCLWQRFPMLWTLILRGSVIVFISNSIITGQRACFGGGAVRRRWQQSNLGGTQGFNLLETVCQRRQVQLIKDIYSTQFSRWKTKLPLLGICMIVFLLALFQHSKCCEIISQWLVYLVSGRLCSLDSMCGLLDLSSVSPLASCTPVPRGVLGSSSFTSPSVQLAWTAPMPPWLKKKVAIIL